MVCLSSFLYLCRGLKLCGLCKQTRVSISRKSYTQYRYHKTSVEAQDEQRYPIVPSGETLYSRKSLPSPGVAHKEAVLISKMWLSQSSKAHKACHSHVKDEIKNCFPLLLSLLSLLLFFVCFGVCLCNHDLFKIFEGQGSSVVF